MSAHRLAPRVLGLAVGIATAACPTVALAQTGACCFPDDICFDGVDGTDCLLVDGRFLGDGLTCNGDPDGDSVFGCYDGCPVDPYKTEPGICGCGIPDDDSDADGVFDCVDLCPGTPSGMPVDESGCPPLGACCFLVGVCIDDTLPDDCFAVGGVHQGAGSTCYVGCILPGRGDVDGDSAVDLDDFVFWAECAAGPYDDPYAEACEPLDFNWDGDVDMADFARFQVAFSSVFSPPDNDDCDDAIDIGDGSQSFSNERASTDGPDESGECAYLERDVWFCYTASCNGTATVDLCTSDFDTVVAVYAGCACPTTNPVMCDDDGCGTQGGGSEVTFTVSKDALYMIRVGGFNGATGGGTLTITCEADGGECQSNADCDDGVFCNGAETCVGGNCQGGSAPCIDDDHCDEENDRCLECLSADECDDGDLCTNDACIDNDCWNIDVQCAPGVCNPDTGECVDCLVNADCQNGLFCDGDEGCSPALECQPGEDPCDDGIGCTIDSCDEGNNRCENAATDARCPDNGLFCDGLEYCNPVSDCTSTGDPCDADETCNEELDRCEVEPARWVSTQLLFPGSPGYKAPESHELDGVRNLVVAHLGLSEATLRETWPTATIEVYTTDVPLGVETDMYRVINDLGGGLTETFVQTVTINAFHLRIRGSTATWEFDYIVVNDVDNPFGHSVTSGQFVGSQEGDISGARDEITWTSVDATFQWCDVGVECDTPTPLDWTLGTWTKQE